MFISVIPLSKSLSKNPFLYQVDDPWRTQIVIGGLIEIPLGKSLVLGIIASLYPHTDTDITDIAYEIRPIHRVLSTTPLVTSGMIQSMLALADRYFLPIHKTASLFLPAPLLTRLEKRNFIFDIPHGTAAKKGHTKHIEIHHYLDRYFDRNRLESYMGPGTICVFPDDVMLSVFFSEKKKSSNILILPAESPSSKKNQAWIDIYEGNYDIIVGTRRILYYNLARYDRIIYIEDAFGDTQFQYPIEMRTLDILRVIADTGQSETTIITSSPTLELFSRFSDAKIISQTS